MAKVLVSDQYLDEIANAIRVKLAETETYTPAEMGDAILSISTSADVRLQQKSVDPTISPQTIIPDTGYQGMTQVRVGAIQTETLNVISDGIYTPTAGKYYSSVTVNTGGGETIELQEKSVTPLESQQTVTPDAGYNGLSRVTVGAIPSQYKDVTPVTATASDVLAGKVIVDANGVSQTGILSLNSYYVGLDVPDNSVGNDNDLYFQV